MGLKTYSAFNYGHTINNNNNLFPVDEGSGEVLVTLRSRPYTLQGFRAELERVLNSQLDNEYTVTLDRSTRTLTIESSATFTIPLASSQVLEISAYSLAGFTGTLDLTGETTYTASSPSGFQFRPQFLLQNFVDFQDQQRAANASVNESASGKVEVASFGNVQIMSCNITLQTNNIEYSEACQTRPIRPDPQGVENLRNFLIYATTKAPLEFIPDIADQEQFISCIIESTPDARDGTGFTLRELYARGLFGYFESGNLDFRRIR